MSDFQTVLLLACTNVEPIEGADKIEKVSFGEFTTVATKTKFSKGLRAYVIPADSVLPDELRDRLGLKDNRVKAVKIKGVTCDCVAMTLADLTIAEGQQLGLMDASDSPSYAPDAGGVLGVTKYRTPAIYEPQRSKKFPAADTRGQEAGRTKKYRNYTLDFDVKNIKHFPDEFGGVDVVVTEKVHGSWGQVCVTPEGGFATSKGLAGKGVAFDVDVPEGDNIWTQVLLLPGIQQLMGHLVEKCIPLGFRFVSVLFEVFGKGVQDLTYEVPDGQKGYMVFDIAVGTSNENFIYLDTATVQAYCRAHGLLYAPVVYQGPFNMDAIKAVTTGNSVIAPRQIREGVVIRPAFERKSVRLPGNRAILKSINPAYLTRGTSPGGEEPTERQ